MQLATLKSRDDPLFSVVRMRLCLSGMLGLKKNSTVDDYTHWLNRNGNSLLLQKDIGTVSSKIPPFSSQIRCF